MTALRHELRNRRLHCDVNERIAQLTTEFGLDAAASDPLMMVLCECGREGCMTLVEMTLSEYQPVRSVGRSARSRLAGGR
jgi:hypothetical protein